ncbi:PP2C family serine/threonine-protein phosphatase [Thalassospira sp. TSL5-1]|uniref:PP2C family serine/threonine-protein phosphatase n=1 Tax=Thalassospira sp. TSL5-1 TaxID=1544451 RepID=UPI00093D1C7E|nr:PP2C family serine/threonine-protein phosphatase [Thalassospira sp. TSL5-1]
MTRSPEQKTYEDLAFRFFVTTLCCNGCRVPSNIPDGLENLTEEELTVLAYLQQVSQERSIIADPEPEDDDPALAGSSFGEMEQEEPDEQHEQEEQDETVSVPVTPEPEIIDQASTRVEENMAIEGNDALDGEGTPSVVSEDETDASIPLNPLAADNAAPPVDETNGDAAHHQMSDNALPTEDNTVIKGPGGIVKTGFEASYSEPERINLKNGRSRQPYETTIQGYSGIEITDDGGTGLSISSDGDVSGHDIQAGEYTLFLKAVKQGEPVVIRARLSIIPDPRDLWKTIPSDQDAPMAKPDQSFDCQTGEGLVVAASKRGRSHAQEGKYRDDDFRIRADTDTGWHILIVADGAGSADLSREGSRIACETVMEALPALLAEKVDPWLEETLARYAADPDAWATEVRCDLLYPVLPEAALRAARAIEDKAAEIKQDPSAFSTTIVIAICRKVADRWFSASFTVGDGGVAIFDAKAETVTVMCRPDSGEFAGQTRFLASTEFRDPHAVMGRVFVDLCDSFTVLAAMTDGITDPKFPTDSAFANAEIWADFWTNDLCAQVDLHQDNDGLKDQMMAWLDFWSRGNHDDRTIALMMPNQNEQTLETKKAVAKPQEGQSRNSAAQDGTDGDQADVQ